MGVPALGMGQSQQTHEGGKIVVSPRPQHQMPVVGHEAIGQNAHADAFRDFRQHFLECGIVFILAEDRLACVGPIEHVVHQPAGGVSQGSSHGVNSLSPLAVGVK